MRLLRRLLRPLLRLLRLLLPRFLASKLGILLLLIVLIVILPVTMLSVMGSLAAKFTEDALENSGTASVATLDRSSLPDIAVRYAPYIEAAGSLCPEITPAIIAGQIETESNWDKNAENEIGAQGLSQFMPATWAQYGRDEDQSGDGANPFNPQDAIMAQGRYDCALVKIIKRMRAGTYTGSCRLRSGQTKPPPRPGEFPLGRGLAALALAAYNAGEGAVCYFRGIPDFTETQSYVSKVLSAASKYESVSGAACSVNDPNACALKIALDFANPAWVKKNYRGKDLTYSWGGGGADTDGPGYGADTEDYSDADVFGFDCSGLVQYAYYKASSKQVKLPRVADDQRRKGQLIAEGTGSRNFDFSNVRPGDAVAFHKGAEYYHIAIYVGKNEEGVHQIVHAYTHGKFVEVTPLSNYYGRYWMFRRFLDAPKENSCATCQPLAAAPHAPADFASWPPPALQPRSSAAALARPTRRHRGTPLRRRQAPQRHDRIGVPRPLTRQRRQAHRQPPLPC